MAEALLGTLLGFLSGMRHALEPDHIAAVSTVLAEQRTPRSSVIYAGLWGVGHALMLLFVGGGLYIARHRVPDHVADLFELAVAAMLVGLGVRALLGLRQKRGGSAVEDALYAHDGHSHDGSRHLYGEHARGSSPSAPRFSIRPLGIGLVHGLAGSGALTALVISKSLSVGVGLGFILVYGIGAALGMVALAGILGFPIARLARDARWANGLLAASGSLALVIGIVWGLHSLHVV